VTLVLAIAVLLWQAGLSRSKSSPHSAPRAVYFLYLLGLLVLVIGVPALARLAGAFCWSWR